MEINSEAMEILVKIHNENFKNKVDVKYFQKMTLDNNYKMYFLEKTINNIEKIVGYIIFYNTIDSVDLFEIAVEKINQGKGWGQELLETSLENLFKEIPYKNMEDKKILLEVSDKNIKAKKFYEKNKFVEIFVRKNYYGSNENGIIMMKKIRD